MTQSDQAMLVEEAGEDGEGAMHMLTAATSMGRQQGNDVVVPEAGVSRQHAEIVESENGYVLRDLQSTNGTFVNSKKIESGDHLLSDGDKVRLGASKLSFIFRSATASTLQISLADLGVESSTGSDTAISEAVAAPDSASAPDSAAGPASQDTIDEELYEGSVRLHVTVEGSMGLMVNFTQQLREKQEFRLLRLANNRSGGVDVWLALREPIPLQRIVGEIDGVYEVSPTEGRDLSPDSEDPPLTVTLKAPDPATDKTPCVNCKEPLEPGVTKCPACGEVQA